MQDELHTSLRLDSETRDLLALLAGDVEDNKSLTIRQLIRKAALAQGLQLEARETKQGELCQT